MKALLPALLLALAPSAWAQDELLDDFAEPAAWTLSASDDVKTALRPDRGPHGSPCASTSTSARSRAT